MTSLMGGGGGDDPTLNFGIPNIKGGVESEGIGVEDGGRAIKKGQVGEGSKGRKGELEESKC